MKKLVSKFNIFLSIILLLGVASSVFIERAHAVTPNPGHPWSEVGDGVFSVTGPTSMRTFTFPDSNATVMTGNGIAKGGIITGTGAGTFGLTSAGTDGQILSADSSAPGGVTWINAGSGGGGSGTVTSVSVTTANGISGTVATATTTPAITLSLGAITPSTVNGLTITSNGSNTLNIAAGKTLVVSNNLTFAGTDGTTMTFPTSSATLARTDAGNTFTGHQTIEGVTSTGATGTGKFVFDTSPTLTTPNLGTPSTLVGTNITGIAAGLTAGTVTTNANLTGPITSSGNATSVASQTGTGSKFVMDTSPTLVTPNIGAAIATTVNGVTISGSSSPSLTVTGASSILGTNTGDQTITLTGEVTGSGTGSFPTTIANGAVTSSKIATGGVSNANLANSTIGLIIGTAGSDIGVSGSPASLGGSITLNIPSASASNRGLLTSTDWTTFNNKQAALGFTPENVANKSTSTTLGASDTLYPTQNAVKTYVDNLSLGLNWQQPAELIDVVADTNSPPVSPVNLDGYIIDSGGNTGAWSGFAVGDLVQYQSSSWIKIKSLAIGDYFGIGFKSATTPSGAFIGKKNYIVEVTGGSAGAFTYTFTAPLNNDAIFDHNQNAFYYNTSFVYSSSLVEWVQLSANTNLTFGGGLKTTGNAVSIDTTTPLTWTGAESFSNLTATNPITGSVTGNAGTATTLSTARAINGVNFDGSGAITVPVNNTDDTSSNATVYPLWTPTVGGNYAAKVSSTKLSFNPSTGVLDTAGLTVGSAPTFSSMSQNSIPFIGAGGLLSEDNTNFIWDEANQQLQIGPSAGFDGNPQIQLSISNNINNYSGVYNQNASSGNSASTDYIFGADNDGTSLVGNYGDLGIEGSGFDPNYSGNALINGLLPDDIYLSGSGGNLVLGGGIGTPGAVIKFFVNGLTSSNQMGTFSTVGLGIGTTTPGALLDLGTAGSTLGVARFAGSTSGNVSLEPNAVAGTNTILTLPSTSGTIALTANNLGVFASTTSAQLAGVISDETGSGVLVYATSPTLSTPVINGLPTGTGVASGNTASTLVSRDSSGNFSAGTITANLTGNASTVTTDANLTGPITSSGNATSVASQTGTGSTFVMQASPTLTTPNLGTPSFITLTNGTDLPISTGVSGLGTNVAAFLGTPSSANLASAITDETGSGALVFATSGTLSTPVINGLPTGTGVASGATVSTLVSRDANGNLSANNSLEGYTTTATAAGTTSFTVGSTYLQYFTGTTTQTVVLPVTSTLVLGQEFLIVNNSTGAVTVESSGTNSIQIMAPSSYMLVTVISTSGTGVASWNAQYVPPISTGNTANALVQRDSSGNFSAGTITANLTGNVSGSSGSTTGNAATATALQNARTINGVSFDGTGNITLAAAAGTLTGSTLASGVTASSLTSFGTSPTLVTPNIGAATATTVNGLTITSSTGTLTIANTKTLTDNNNLTFSGTDGSTLNIGTGGTLGSAAYTSSSAYEVPLTFSTGLTRSTNTITDNLAVGVSGGQSVIGGTGTTDVLSLKGTTGNGTATSPAIQALVGNNGGTTAMTILNNGNIGIGIAAPTSNLDMRYSGTNNITTDQVTVGSYPNEISSPFNILSSDNQTTNYSGSVYPEGASIEANVHGSGNLTGINGASFSASYSGSGTLSDGLYGIVTGADLTSGTATNVAGEYITSNITSGATTTNNYGLWISNPGGTGTITNNYGLLIADQTSGSSNWAIKTGAGTVQFGTLSGSGTKCIQTNNNGVLSVAGSGCGTLTVGTSSVASGTGGNVLYDNSGTLGEMTTTGSGTVLALATSPTLSTPVINGLPTGTGVASGNTASTLVSRDSSGNFSAGTITANLTGNVSGSSGSTTGNAATATALQNARTINGVSFDGTGNITLAAAAGTLTGSTLASGVTASSLTSFGTSPTLVTPNIGAATATGLTLSGITGSVQCLHVNSSGVVSGTTSDCGSGGGGGGALTVGSSTISGGSSGNIEYNNGGILGEMTTTGSGTVLALATAPTFTTSLTAPLIIGGTGATSPLTLRSTSGVGTAGADIIFQTGNNGANEALRILNSGSVGIGTPSPNRELEVYQASSNAQLRLSQSGSVYAEIYADASGDLQISSTGTAGVSNVRINNGNLWVCAGGSCGATAPTSNGNLIVENSIILDNNFTLKQTSSTTVDMNDSTGATIIEFDQLTQ